MPYFLFDNDAYSVYKEKTYKDLHGAVAQLGERLNGIQEAVGSIPISSTF